MKQQEKYKYFAFISYSHKDIEMAKRLEQFLCDFRLPVHLSKKYPDSLRKFNDVFLDNSSMNACSDLTEEIKRHLDESEHLFIVCSPNSANSTWVRMETNYFKNIRGGKNIFPFVVSGIVNASEKDKRKECIPEPIRPFRGRAANVSTYSFEHAVIEIIAGIIHIDVDEIWQRHVRLEEEKKRQLKEQNDRLLIAQSRYIAEKSNALVEEGDSYLARRLLLNVLPSDLSSPDRPLTLEAEQAFRKACERDTAILRGHEELVLSASFNHDGSLLVSSSYMDKNQIGIGYTIIWNTNNGKRLSVHENNNIVAVAYTKTGEIVCKLDNGEIRYFGEIQPYYLNKEHKHTQAIKKMPDAITKNRMFQLTIDGGNL